MQSISHPRSAPVKRRRRKSPNRHRRQQRAEWLSGSLRDFNELADMALELVEQRNRSRDYAGHFADEADALEARGKELADEVARLTAANEALLAEVRRLRARKLPAMAAGTVLVVPPGMTDPCFGRRA